METYLGNPNLKKANVTQEWTKQEVEEYAKCMKDPLYFIQEYIKIVSLDEGLVPFKLITVLLSVNFLDNQVNQLPLLHIYFITFYLILL